MLTFQFPPARSNEVRRVQKICKYLTRNGIHVDVVASANPGTKMDDDWRLNDILSDNLFIKRINHFNYKSKSRIGRIISTVFRLDWQFSYSIKLSYLLWKNRKSLNEYEYIYCTIRPYSMLFLPKVIKTICKTKILIDFRFLFYLESYYYKKIGMINVIYKYIDKLLLKSALKNSDYRISLTDSLGNILRSETKYSFYTIEQGYDSEERNIKLYEKDEILFYEEGKINVVYTGSVAPTQADPNEMAEVIQIMLESNKNLIFHFFGLVEGLKKKLMNNSRIKFYNYLNYRQFVFVIQKADILWMYYSNNNKNDFRVGTKTYDYMNFGKPILCFCSINQETVRVLSKYESKCLIHEDYKRNATLINFEKLKDMKISEPNNFDIFRLYYPFIDPSKYIK